MQALQIGQSIDGKYTIERKVASGGMSTVYLAQDISLNRKVAIKVLHSNAADSNSKERMVREARALCELIHRNIVRLYHLAFLENQVPYLALEFVEGETLRDVLMRDKCFCGDSAVAIAIDICSGMEFAHSLNIIHRDLKPENIILSKEGGGLIPKLVDFGLCKLVTGTSNATLTSTGLLVGTAQYMDPELVVGHKCTLTSDIYSFGCMLFEMLTGEAPFVSENPAAIYAMHVANPFPGIKATTAQNMAVQDLQSIILKCSHKNPEKRYQNFAEVKEALQQLNVSQLNHRFERSAEVIESTNRMTSAGLKGILCALPFLLFAAMACLAFSDAGNSVIAVQAQNFLSPDDSIGFLHKYVAWLFQHERASGAEYSINVSIRSRMFNMWPRSQQRKLILNYITMYREFGKNKEAFDLSLKLLADLLDAIRRLDQGKPKNNTPWDSTAKSITTDYLLGAVSSPYHFYLHSSEPQDVEMLEKLSKSLLDLKLDNKQWKQIANVFELHDLAVSSDYPPDPMWTGALRVEAALRQQQNYSPDFDQLNSLTKLCLFTAQTFGKSNDNEAFKRAERYYSEVERITRRYDEAPGLKFYSGAIGLYYLKAGKFELARKYYDEECKLPENKRSKYFLALGAGLEKHSFAAAENILAKYAPGYAGNH